MIHLVNCRIQTGEQGEQHKTLSVIRCTNTDRAIHEYFLRCLHPIVASLRQSPSRDQISEAVQKLVDLFRRMADAPRKAVAGLWAELFPIARSSDPACLLAAWHAIPEERFDFGHGIDRLLDLGELNAVSGSPTADWGRLFRVLASAGKRSDGFGRFRREQPELAQEFRGPPGLGKKLGVNDGVPAQEFVQRGLRSG